MKKKVFNGVDWCDCETCLHYDAVNERIAAEREDS